MQARLEELERLVAQLQLEVIELRAVLGVESGSQPASVPADGHLEDRPGYNWLVNLVSVWRTYAT